MICSTESLGMFFNQKSSLSARELPWVFTKNGHGFANFSVKPLDLLTKEGWYTFLELFFNVWIQSISWWTQSLQCSMYAPRQILDRVFGCFSSTMTWAFYELFTLCEADTNSPSHTAKNNHVCPPISHFSVITRSWLTLAFNGWKVTVCTPSSNFVPTHKLTSLLRNCSRVSIWRHGHENIPVDSWWRSRVVAIGQCTAFDQRYDARGISGAVS